MNPYASISSNSIPSGPVYQLISVYALAITHEANCGFSTASRLSFRLQMDPEEPAGPTKKVYVLLRLDNRTFVVYPKVYRDCRARRSVIQSGGRGGRMI